MIRQRDRQTERRPDTQNDRWAESHTHWADIKTDKQRHTDGSDGQIERQTDRDRKVGRQTQRQTDRQGDKWMDRQTGGQTDKII